MSSKTPWSTFGRSTARYRDAAQQRCCQADSLLVVARRCDPPWPAGHDGDRVCPTPGVNLTGVSCVVGGEGPSPRPGRSNDPRPRDAVAMRTDPALEALVEECHGPVVGMLTLYVGDQDVARELAQDALVKLCEHWDDVAVMDNPAGWVTTVAFNHARSWWRRRYAQRRARRRHGESPTTSTRPDTETAIVVQAAVAELPPRQRQAVILRYFDDRSVAETAQMMGCADGTVKSLTSRARTSLRRHDIGLVGDHAPASRSSRPPVARDLTVDTDQPARQGDDT